MQIKKINLSIYKKNLQGLFDIIKNHIVSYATPRNLNSLWSGGALLGIFFVVQLISGLILTVNYTADIVLGFSTVEHIMRDIPLGWIFRYFHANGASILFLLLYIHMGRGLYFGSYISPRAKVWYSGSLLFIIFMAEAFTGYVLPWGQMGFWGATVITNLFTSIPFIGDFVLEWIWGGFSVDNPIIHRFYTLHMFLFPLIILGSVLLHIFLLHKVGSSNPVSSETTRSPTGFTPYFGLKDAMFVFLVLGVLFLLVFFYSNILGHPDNYIAANSLVTPSHIVPEWYFLPFYAILRAIPSKLGGIVVAACALLGLIVLPLTANLFLEERQSRVDSENRIRFFWVFVINFFLLGWLGALPVEYPYSMLGLVATVNYFLLLIAMIFRVNISYVYFVGLVSTICLYPVISENLVTNTLTGNSPTVLAEQVDPNAGTSRDRSLPYRRRLVLAFWEAMEDKVNSFITAVLIALILNFFYRFVGGIYNSHNEAEITGMGSGTPIVVRPEGSSANDSWNNRPVTPIVIRSEGSPIIIRPEDSGANDSWNNRPVTPIVISTVNPSVAAVPEGLLTGDELDQWYELNERLRSVFGPNFSMLGSDLPVSVNSPQASIPASVTPKPNSYELVSPKVP